MFHIDLDEFKKKCIILNQCPKKNAHADAPWKQQYLKKNWGSLSAWIYSGRKADVIKLLSYRDRLSDEYSNGPPLRWDQTTPTYVFSSRYHALCKLEGQNTFLYSLEGSLRIVLYLPTVEKQNQYKEVTRYSSVEWRTY